MKYDQLQAKNIFFRSQRMKFLQTLRVALPFLITSGLYIIMKTEKEVFSDLFADGEIVRSFLSHDILQNKLFYNECRSENNRNVTNVYFINFAFTHRPKDWNAIARSILELTLQLLSAKTNLH
ncbi:hypothetical protein [Bacteroides pyogenes]|uniref:hypothetical protein n=1 Tax=Bacteroides pyogenes TaxID=310300 RepID=UPI0011E3BD4A|nr:hypothetical protein [Bacteroides pyogenes]MBR8707541.1 hypothetical protein [Bacteroides pyogenes]MBR8745801.1 hypothetical protein [Bacteroides pyogenes]MBR8756100.1 hypothetical protein [Bacteroides pyogenes]MBR8779412.1 hypothetical protein [Bacteroides pyogenes]TYK39865.1 hypothetical protein FNJ59_06270 [Bacteroides pyogenes]